MDKYTLVENFIHTIDDTIVVEFDDEEFFCVLDENIVNVSFEEDDYTDYVYSEFLFENFNEYFNIFLLSILHEVGHLMTWTEELATERERMYLMLQLGFNSTNAESYDKSYFSIPMEYMATEWAVNYYRKHREQCDNFICQLAESED